MLQQSKEKHRRRKHVEDVATHSNQHQQGHSDNRVGGDDVRDHFDSEEE